MIRKIAISRFHAAFAGFVAALALGGCVGAPISTPGTDGGFAVVSDAADAPAGAWRLVVHSGIVGRDFVVVVTPPPFRKENLKVLWDAPVKFPAIYALDGGYGVAGPIGAMMVREGLMAPACVVEISYPAGEDSRRNTDLLFRQTVDTEGLIGGGGQKFTGFLTRELKPYLEERFDLDERHAVLFGHSFGGVFALNVLATQPDAFDGYIIASPSVLHDEALMAGLPEDAKRAKGRRAFVAVGGNELVQMQAGAGKVASVLQSAGLTVESRVFAGEGHISYYPLLAPAAFAWMFPPEKAR